MCFYKLSEKEMTKNNLICKDTINNKIYNINKSKISFIIGKILVKENKCYTNRKVFCVPVEEKI